MDDYPGKRDLQIAGFLIGFGLGIIVLGTISGWVRFLGIGVLLSFYGAWRAYKAIGLGQARELDKMFNDIERRLKKKGI